MKNRLLWWLRKWPLAGAVAMGLAGCAGLNVSTTAAKTVGSVCAGAGAGMATLALIGTPAQNKIALEKAAIMTPECSASSPGTAASAALIQAAQAIEGMAATDKVTGGTKS